MEERILVSGGDELRTWSLPSAQKVQRIALEDAGALCAWGDTLYVSACEMIWRIDARRLVPAGLFAGGPGVCRLMAAPSGNRLYALCSEADSLLMLDAHSGAPLMVNRVGVGPCAMSMDESGRTMAVAGGGDGEVVLLEAETLCVQQRLHTEGMTFGALLLGGHVYALSLNEAMGSTLTAFLPSGERRTLRLPGMPGALEAIDGQIVAATHERIWIIAPDGSRVLSACDASGRAGRIWRTAAGMILLDTWSESLFLRGRTTGHWRLLADRVADAVVLPGNTYGCRFPY